MLAFVQRFGFLFLIGLGLAEYLVALAAPPWYFRTGIPVFRRHYRRGGITPHDLAHRIAQRAPNRILFRQSPGGVFGLREHFAFYLLYSALIHWQLRPSECGDGWTLLVRYKLWPAIIDVLGAATLLSSGGLDGFMAVALIGWFLLITATIVVVQMLQVRFLREILT